MPQAAAPLELVLFDLGGVLIDWDPRRLYRKIIADEAAMERFLSTVCTPAWNLELDRGRSFALAVEELVAQHPEERPLIEAYQQRWLEMIGGPIGGTVALLEELATRRTPLRALTNWSAETFTLVHSDPDYDFLGRFAHIYVSGALGMIKPDDDIFEHVLEDTGLPAGSILFIDDSAANIRTAERLGFVTHRFAGADGLERHLRDLQLVG
ncbi:MAG: HAD family phosphatase [Geminicoccaceae bacterium]